MERLPQCNNRKRILKMTLKYKQTEKTDIGRAFKRWIRGRNRSTDQILEGRKQEGGKILNWKRVYDSQADVLPLQTIFATIESLNTY